MRSICPPTNHLLPFTKTAAKALSTAVAVLATACGGGGEPAPAFNGSPPVVTLPPPTPSVALPSDHRDYGWLGAFSATTSGTPGVTLLVSRSPDYGLLGVYGEDAATDFKVRGLLTIYTYGPNRYELYDPIRATAIGDITFDPTASTISGTFTQGNQQLPIAGAAFAAPGYHADQPASLSAIMGRWELTTSEGRRISMDIGVNGDITGTSGSCAIYGSKVTPTRTGFGLFAITLRFTEGPSGCREPHGQSDGVYGFAVVYASSSGGTQLVIAAENGWDAVFLAAAGKR